jgi:multidrug efflux pump subunit AcrA (membrane-fusion protein)
MRHAAVVLLSLAALLASSGCRGRQASDGATSESVIVVNAPESGVVRRVLVREGMTVGADDPLFEIAVATEGASDAQPKGEDPQKRAAAGYVAAQGEIEAARAEVVRYEVEVQRLTPLVAAGQATQGELDGARALYDRAQQRLRQAQESAQRAQGSLVAARSQPQSPASTAPPPERVVLARATSAATVSAVSARAGQRVNAGQPLATLRPGER